MFGNKPKSRSAKIETLIGTQTSLVGNISFAGGLHIDGKIEGNIDATDDESTLVLSEHGYVCGDIHAANLVLNGKIEGDVYASDHVELLPSARIKGNVYYNLMQMSVGAEVNGKMLHQAGGKARLEHKPEESTATNGNTPAMNDGHTTAVKE